MRRENTGVGGTQRARVERPEYWRVFHCLQLLPKAKVMPMANTIPGDKFVSPESIASGLPLKGGFFIESCVLWFSGTHLSSEASEKCTFLSEGGTPYPQQLVNK